MRIKRLLSQEDSVRKKLIAFDEKFATIQKMEEMKLKQQALDDADKLIEEAQADALKGDSGSAQWKRFLAQEYLNMAHNYNDET